MLGLNQVVMSRRCVTSTLASTALSIDNDDCVGVATVSHCSLIMIVYLVLIRLRERTGLQEEKVSDYAEETVAAMSTTKDR